MNTKSYDERYEVFGKHYSEHELIDSLIRLEDRVAELENDIARLSQPDDIHRRYLADCI